jgi:hypothetical protein
MAILAMQARETALAAKKSLEDTVVFSNKNFDDSMDETFTLAGGWMRAGSQYVRDIVVHSTLFTSAITDTVVVGAYKWFVMDYWELNTRLDDAYLDGLDYLGIQGIIGLVQGEIQTKSEEVFGNGEGDGLFTNWIGTEPVLENGTVAGGSGEMGRLLREYYTWSIKQSEGIALMSAPPWDKPMWDSRGSFFDAPSLRTVTDIGVKIAATAFSGGTLGFLLDFVDDALFSVLDVVGGYKTWDEAGFEFGKKALIGAVSSGAGKMFESLEKVAVSSFTGVLGQTAVSGVKAVSTGTLTSALSAVTYNSRDGLGWSKDAFGGGFLGGLTSAAIGMTSSFTGGTLGLINSGENLKGFSLFNIKDVGTLNKTLGGLAGQGVNYAITGDFALNLFNVQSIGVLELHLGNRGFGMNLGMDGMDASFDTIAGTFRGAAVWGTNTRINHYAKEKKLNIPVTLRAQYGFGDTAQKEQLWDILAGRAEIIVGNGDYEGKTVTEDGKRTIYLGQYKEDMTVSEQMRLGAILGHEAYRDGVVGEENYLETRIATNAHTEMAIRMLQGGYKLEIDGNLSKDLNAYVNANGNADLFNAYVDSNYNSSADYWRLVQREDGSFGVQYDGNHSLLDENGNILVQSFLDLFNEAGEIIGHRAVTPDSYIQSLGMLMGMYPTFSDSADSAVRYNQYNTFAGGYTAHFTNNIRNILLGAGFAIGGTISNPANNGSLGVNPFLMTYKGIISGEGIQTTHDGDSTTMSIWIKNEFDQVVGLITQSTPTNNINRNYFMVENMIPEERRLKAGTFSIEVNNGNPIVKMFGLGSTMPDPSRMGVDHPALADGTYSSAWAMHRPLEQDGDRAFRLYCAAPTSWSQVSGPVANTDITNFPDQAIDNWGNPAYRGNFPAYYYTEGLRKDTTTNAINGHPTYSNPYIYNSKENYTAGSDGCLVWPKRVFDDLARGLQTTRNPFAVAWGSFTINRSIFGDGTNNQNNWWAP